MKINSKWNISFWLPIFFPKLLKTCTCVAFIFKNIWHKNHTKHRRYAIVIIFPKSPQFNTKLLPSMMSPITSCEDTHHVVWCHSQNISHHMMSFTLWFCILKKNLVSIISFQIWNDVMTCLFISTNLSNFFLPITKSFFTNR